MPEYTSKQKEMEKVKLKLQRLQALFSQSGMFNDSKSAQCPLSLLFPYFCQPVTVCLRGVFFFLCLVFSKAVLKLRA